MLFKLIAMWATLEVATGHGRLIEPPSRSTMWRYGFKTPPNYNDHELYCGGLQRMIRNGGRCGICGDPSDAPPPRPNEVGGRYANGIVVRHYQPNQEVQIQVEITAYHKGYIEFKICPTNDPKKDPTQECLDENILRLADGTGRTKFYVPVPDPKGGGKYKINYTLPKQMACSFCVLQWTYVAGNNWGRCKNGTEGIGCGHQETFRACADIAIGEGTGNDVHTNEIPHSFALKLLPHFRVFMLIVAISLFGQNSR